MTRLTTRSTASSASSVSTLPTSTSASSTSRWRKEAGVHEKRIIEELKLMLKGFLAGKSGKKSPNK